MRSGCLGNRIFQLKYLYNQQQQLQKTASTFHTDRHVHTISHPSPSRLQENHTILCRRPSLIDRTKVLSLRPLSDSSDNNGSDSDGTDVEHMEPIQEGFESKESVVNDVIDTITGNGNGSKTRNDTKNGTKSDGESKSGKVPDNTKLFDFEIHRKIEEFFKEQNMTSVEGHTCYITTCTKTTKLGKKRKGSTAELDNLFINKRTGCFVCRQCGSIGTWIELKDNLAVFNKAKARKNHLECLKDVAGITQVSTQTPAAVQELMANSDTISTMTAEEYAEVQTMFGCQAINKETMSKFMVSFNKTNQSLIIPIVSQDKVIVGSKVMKTSIDEEGDVIVQASIVPRTMSQEWFGWQGYDEQKEIAVANSIFDAMAITQETKRLAIALAKPNLGLSQELLPYMERFDKITLWFESDLNAWDMAKKFAIKLNTKRCHIIRPSIEMPNPLQCLRLKINLKRILDKAQPICHKSIVSFADIREDVKAEFLQSDQATGMKWKRFPSLNKILKGHRAGELTVFTGPTGSGKTTFIAEYSLDLCMQGKNTLWGSFEIKNSRLAQILMSQYTQKNMFKHLDEFESVADDFSQLPMHFMTFHGQEDIRTVSEAMSHAAYVHDIEHVVVDNLQFLMGMDFNVTNRFLKQDQMIASFRKFATAMNCHVTLIIHPKKERDNENLMISSIFGSAKATQEADNVLILQDKRMTAPSSRKCVQVMKNRFDGDLGTMVLKFDKETKSFAVKEVKESKNKEMTMKAALEEQEENKFVN